MVVIGFRSFPTGIAYVVLGGTQGSPDVLESDYVPFPKDANWGHSLSWVRKQVLELLKKHAPDRVALKRPEPAARKKSLPRSEVEGVVKEAVHSSLRKECDNLLVVHLKRDIEGFTGTAKYLNTVLSGKSLDALNKVNVRDAALVAIACLPS